jgi:NifB/MoaA-like Fe-S oxidoreductase
MYEFAVTPAITQLRRPGVLITEVAPESLAEELELAPNDRIVRVNGRVVRDYLDFRFQTAGETELTLQVKKPNGETWELEIEREEGEDFGLMFEQIVPRQCANECLFCFCKGNPEDARPSLFVRDEDIRLSFLYGNYTTFFDHRRRNESHRRTASFAAIRFGSRDGFKNARVSFRR